MSAAEIRTTDDLLFPVFVAKGGNVDMSPTKAHLQGCTKTALNNGWFSGLRIIDAAGREVRVVGARNPKRVGKLFNGLFAPRLYVVELVLGDSHLLTLEEYRTFAKGALRPLFINVSATERRDILSLLDGTDSSEEIADVAGRMFFKPSESQ